MSKLLLFSHSGFLDENANGITMKNLLSAWDSEDKAEFYCDVQPPDFSAAHDYFRVTDMQMLTAFAGKKTKHIFRVRESVESQKTASHSVQKESPSRIPAWLKRKKYNFAIKWLRELLWEISPWGHRALERWIDNISPDVVIYMVGESIFMDRLVLRTVKRKKVPLVLYNSEAYRLIDLNERTGLERAYYRKIEKSYQELNQRAALVIYNCELLLEGYSEKYPVRAKQMTAYNSASNICSKYRPGDSMTITYFGNLGVGRADSILQTADILRGINQNLHIDVYGNANAADEDRLRAHPNISYHGFVSQAALQKIIERSDILLHVESFDPEIVPRLRYAFSTKIAQCLCAGRPLLCYAPEGSASVEYLKDTNGALVAVNLPELKRKLEQLVLSGELRKEYAARASQIGKENHRCENTSAAVREKIEGILG